MNKFISPVYNILKIHIDQIQANDYNPNVVATPELKLLEDSIWEDGFTMPIVTYYDASINKYIIVDGFHRYTIMKTSKKIYDREEGYLPVSIITKDISNRIASTIRHNRARGNHNIDLMSNIVKELVELGKSDKWIRQHLGMSKDEILRLKQVTGLISLFEDEEFSNAWIPE